MGETGLVAPQGVTFADPQLLDLAAGASSGVKVRPEDLTAAAAAVGRLAASAGKADDALTRVMSSTPGDAFSRVQGASALSEAFRDACATFHADLGQVTNDAKGMVSALQDAGAAYVAADQQEAELLEQLRAQYGGIGSWFLPTGPVETMRSSTTGAPGR